MRFWTRSIRPVDRTRRLSTSARRPNRNGRLRPEDLEGRTLLSTYNISEVLNVFTGAKGVEVQVDSNPATVTYNPTTTFVVNTASGVNTVNILNTSQGLPIEIAGQGYDTINVGTAGSVQGIKGAVSFGPSATFSQISINDGSDTANETVTLSSYTPSGDTAWGSITGLAPAAINYRYANTGGMVVNAGTGSVTFNVQATGAPLYLGNAGTGTVNVGNANSVQGIAASLTVEPTGSGDVLNVNDSADTTARNVTLGNDGGTSYFGSITGLAPTTIVYTNGHTSSVNVTTGADTVNVQAAGVPIVLNDAGAGTVNVGNAGRVQSLFAQLTVEDTSGSDALNINDSIDTTARNVTLSNQGGVAVWGQVTGLAPATIVYEESRTSSLSLTTGAVSDTVNVQATGAPTYLVGGWTDTVNVGSGGTVAGILGTLYLENPPAHNAINVNDGSDTTARRVTLNTYTPSGDSAWGSITGLAPAAIDYRYADTTSMSLTTGTGSNVVNVLATGAPTYLIGEMYDTVNVGTTGSGAGNLAGFLGTLFVENPSWSTTLNVNDGADATARTVTLGSYTPGGDTPWGSITGLASGAINYRFADTNGLNLTTGMASDTVNVQATGPTTYLTGEWDDTVNVGSGGTVAGIHGSLYLENPPAYNTINVNDGSDATARTVTLNTYTPSGDSAWGSITGLAPAAIDYRFADTTSVNLTTGSASDTVNVLATGVATHISGESNDTVNVGNNGTVAGILGTLLLQNPPAYNTLNVNDGSDATVRTVTLSSYTPSGDSAWGSITGLAPAAIDYRFADTTSMNLTMGSGNNKVNVQTTGVTTYLVSTGAETVVVGNNASVAGIDGTLFVDGWQTTLDLEDSSDAAVRTADLSTISTSPVLEGSITGLAPAAIEFFWANMTGGVNATAGWEVHWDVNPNAMESQVGLVQVADDGIVINASSSGNWSGYVAESNFSSPQSNSVSAVYGGWTVPTVTGPSPTGSFHSSIWVGIDGLNGSTVEQIGTEQDYVNGTASYQAWWEMYSSNGSNTNGEKYEYPIPTSQMPINPGDSVFASVQYLSTGTHAGQFLLTIVNNTQNKTFSTYETSSQTQSPLAERNSAEWIVEAPTFNNAYATLPSFGYVTFTNVTAVINGVFGAVNATTWQSEALVIDPNGTAAVTTTTLYNSGESFQVANDILNLISYSTTTAMAVSPGGGGVVGGPSAGAGSRTAVDVEPGNPSRSFAGTAGSAAESVVDQALSELVAFQEALPGRTVVAQGGDEGDATPLGRVRPTGLTLANLED